ncbi:MAG: glycosyltransferase family 2 protein [Candidatus Levybacteria bacterium]|nr:glycosyltransferase family 2 protein [Candidatus Levybacteria bacterium]
MAKPFTFTESLSIVIPSYNEEGSLNNLVKETLRDVKGVVQDFEIIIINDGSSDKTALIADSLAKVYKNVKVIHHKKNQGLALAWWHGIQASKKDVILYIEGDGQQPFRDQYDLLEKIKHADLALGVRSDRFDYSPFRKALSYGYLFLIWLFFNLKYKDVGWSQAYRRKIFEKVEIKSITPFFDTEVVIKVLRNGFKVVEARSFYRRREAGLTSLGNIKTAYKMFKEMIKMRLGFLN